MNNDGIDVDSSRNAVIENFYCAHLTPPPSSTLQWPSDFSRMTWGTDDGGDDAIALKSGLCKAGVDFATPTANVRIEHAVMRTRDACFCTGSEDEGGSHNVTIFDLSCRDSPKAILLKDASTFGGLHPPKSNFSIERVQMHNISLWWHVKMTPGVGLTIQGVEGIRVSNVVGTMVPTAGSMQLASGVALSNISILPGGSKHGWHCGSNVSGVTSSGTVSPAAPCGSLQ